MTPSSIEHLPRICKALGLMEKKKKKGLAIRIGQG
jgi:hypothetical protein